MKKMKNLFIIGIVSLFVGGFMLFTNKDSSSENIEIAQNATNAQDAARMISQNNRKELGGSLVGKFLAGFGLSLTIVSAIGMVKAKKNEK